jgi:hypothetical protein
VNSGALEGLSNPCSTSGTHRVTIHTNQVKCHEWQKEVIVIMTNETYPRSFVIWGHIIFTLSQPVFHLLLNAACKAEKQLIQNLTLWFELTKNLTLIYHTWDDVTNHYTTRWLVSILTIEFSDNILSIFAWNQLIYKFI